MINIPLCYLKEKLPEIFSLDNKEIINKISKWGLEVNFVNIHQQNIGDDDFISFLPSFNRIDLNFLDYIIEEIKKIFFFENILIIPEQKRDFDELKKIPFIKKEKFLSNNNLLNYSFILFNIDILNIVFKDNNLYSLIKEVLQKNNIILINNFLDIINFLMLETGRGVKIFFLEDDLELEKIVIEEDSLFSPFLKLKDIKLNFIHGNALKFFKKEETKNFFLQKYFFLFFDNSIFGKNINDNISTVLILDRLIFLLSEISNFEFIDNSLFIHHFNNKNNEKISTYFPKIKKFRKKIDISLKYIEKKLGLSFNFLEIGDILNKLFFSWIKTKDIFCIKVPFDRFDLNYPEDILGEISKVFHLGYINELINNHGNRSFIEDEKNNYINGFFSSPYEERKIISFLSDVGWNELLTYSLINKQEFSVIDDCFDGYSLINPKNNVHEFYRNSMIFSHLKVIDYNLNRGNNNLFFFEISSLFDNSYLNKHSFYKLNNKYIFLSSIGDVFQNSFSFSEKKIDLFWMKGILENIFDIFNIYDFSISSFSFKFLEQGFKIFLENKEEVGFLGILKKNVYNEYKSLSNLNREVIVMQLNLNSLEKKNNNLLIKVPSSYPSTYRDISLAFHSKKEIDYKKIIKMIENFLSRDNILDKVEIFDIYQSNEMKIRDEESVSFRIIFQNHFRTFDGKDIDIIIERIIEYINLYYSAKLR